MSLLRITGMALLVAPSMAALLTCNELDGQHFTGFALPVSDIAGGCGASYCPNGNHPAAVSQPWDESICTRVGMRMCTMQELQDGWAQGSGCGFDAREVWSSDTCAWGKKTYNWVDKTSNCRVTDGLAYGSQYIRCCADPAPPCNPMLCPMMECPPGQMPAKADPSDCCDSVCIEGTTMSGGGSDWRMGRVADDVYRCKESQCYVSSKEKRNSWVITTAPEDVTLTGADFFAESTSDGQWFVQDGTLMFSDGSSQISFPFECDCKA